MNENNDNVIDSIKIKENHTPIYVSGSISAASQADIRLMLLEIEVKSDEEGRIYDESVSNYHLVMTPFIARQIYDELGARLSQFNLLPEQIEEENESEEQNEK